MAFDASHYGDSTGEPRFMESPAIRAEDFYAGLAFLSNHRLVDPDRIGVRGICGSGRGTRSTPRRWTTGSRRSPRSACSTWDASAGRASTARSPAR
jgi:hypothetical protein